MTSASIITRTRLAIRSSTNPLTSHPNPVLSCEGPPIGGPSQDKTDLLGFAWSRECGSNLIEFLGEVFGEIAHVGSNRRKGQ